MSSKAISMVIVSLVKAIIALSGLLATFGYLAYGLIKKENTKIKRAAIVFYSNFYDTHSDNGN